MADLVEVDVHSFRGRLEVRHAKVLWPFAIRWDRWYFVRKGAPRPTLDDVLRSSGPDTRFWLDLKGFDQRLTTRVLDRVTDRSGTMISSRSWWILPSRRQGRNVHVVHSVGSRLQLFLLQRRSPASIEAVAIDRRLVDARAMAGLQRVTSTVIVWGVTTLEEGLEAVDAGAAGLIVDGIDTLTRLRERLAGAGDDRIVAPGRTITPTRPFA